MSISAHNKQFILGPLAVGIRPDWRTVRIADGLILSHCPKLRVESLHSSDRVQYWLLVLAVRVDEPIRSISDGFKRKTSAEIENWTGFWAGRWALISADRCLRDAAGCLGIF